MVIYFIVISLIIFGEFVSDKYSKIYFMSVILLSILFFCFGYMTGSDWRQYEPMYNNIVSDVNFIEIFIEPGFYYYMLLCKISGVGFWPFLIITKIIILLVFIFFVKRFNIDNLYIGLSYFLVSFGLFYFIDNPLRNLIAAAIFLFSLKYVLERKFWKFSFLVIIASTFHLSALITLPFYFIFNLNLRKSFWIIAYFLVILFSIVFREKIIDWIINLFSNNVFIGGKIDYYFKNKNYLDARFLTIGSIAKLIFFFLILISKKFIYNSSQYGRILFNGSMIFLIINRLASSIEILSRFQLFSAVLFCITVVLIIKNFEPLSRKIYVTFLVIIIYLTVYKEITTTYKYVPYTNYLLYLDKNIPFYERANYNFVNSPYSEE